MKKRTIFSRYWYVKADDMVYGPDYGDYTDTTVRAWGDEDDAKEAAVNYRCRLYAKSEVSAAKAKLRSVGAKNIRAVSVTVYKKV